MLSYADMAVRRLTETGHWTGEQGLDLPEGRYLATRLTLAYGDFLAADADSATGSALRRPGWRRPTPPGRLPATPCRRRSAAARSSCCRPARLDSLASGEAEAGLATLRQAAETERDIPAEFGPPLVEKPSFELLGDVLARMGRREEARQAYAARWHWRRGGDWRCRERGRRLLRRGKLACGHDGESLRWTGRFSSQSPQWC